MLADSVAPTLIKLSQKPALRGPLLKLLADHFPAGSPVSNPVTVDQEFALLLAPANSARNFLLMEGDRPLASASYRVFDVRVPGARRALRCAGIGLVVTAPDARGRGHATRIQGAIEAAARAEGCELAVLWSDRVSFYTNLGYVIAGAERQWVLDAAGMARLGRRLEGEATPLPLGATVRPLTSLRETLPVYEALGIGPVREPARWDPLLALPQTYSAAVFGPEPAPGAARPCWGYALLGKARDLRDTIHEILVAPAALQNGGALARSVVPALFTDLLIHCERSLRVHQPEGAALQEELNYWLGEGERTALAFFKVLDPAKLCEWVSHANVLGPNLRARELPRGGFTLDEGGAVFFESGDIGHLLQLAFGPWRPDEMHDLPDLVRRRLVGLRVPSVYFWGFDSV